ncbi:MAG TPA: hypothetical protein VM925_18700, partial [Labilithrix sp.]|nr:hypothetical protein [Labilithrix sp.]
MAPSGLRPLSSAFVPALAFLVPIVASIAACYTDDPPPAKAIRPVIARFTTGGEAVPSFLDVPFPSDAYLDGASGRYVKIPGLERTFKNSTDLLAAQLEQLNGWSRIAPAMFLVDDLLAPVRDIETGERGSAVIDRASLPVDEKACTSDASSVFLLDLDATDGVSARVPCRAFFHDESTVEGGQSVVAVGPARGLVLREGGHYLAVLTSRVRSVRGFGVLPSKDFEATAVRKEGPLGGLYGGAYDKAMSILGGALGTDAIVSLAPFTTQNVTGEIYALRDTVESTPVAALEWDAAALAPMASSKFAAKVGDALPAGFTATLDDWLGVLPEPKKLPDGSDDPDDELAVRAHDKIAAFGTAVFQAINWLQTMPRKYDHVDHRTFARDAAGKPIPAPDKPTNKIWVSFAIPTAPMPVGGYPAVIIQHGLSQSRAYMLTLANRFASKGWIAVAIDSITFGARANDPSFLVDTTTDYGSAPGVTYKGPDGLSDAVGDPPARAGSFDLFGGLKNLGALGDQLRQAELDTAQLVRLLRSNPDLSPLATGAPPVTPKIDPEKIAYVGDSLGGIEGSAAAAIEPHVKAWVLNVAGGGLLTEVAAHAPSINAQLSLGGSLNFGFTGGQFNEGHPLVVIAQALSERGDPIAYADKLVKSPMPLAGAATKPRNVLQIEVMFDEIVSSESNEALARAAGYGLATPDVGPNAGLADLASSTPFRGGGIELTRLTPDGTGFHDTPVPGVTALQAQVSPGHHGADLVRSKANRAFKIPFNTSEGKLLLERQESITVPCP